MVLNVTMVNATDFTKRLEKIMDYYALSAAALAEEIDFNRSTISHLLSGRNKPSLEFVMKLYQKFPEIAMDWLLFGKGSFPSLSEKPNSYESTNQKTASEAKSMANRTVKDYEAQNRPTEDTSLFNGIEKIVIFYADGSFKVYQN